MSRLGKKPVILPQGVCVEKRSEHLFVVKGPKGSLEISLLPGVAIQVEETRAIVSIDKRVRASSFHGLYRSLLHNAVEGVTKGFEKRLTLVGIGYRAQLKGQLLGLSVGQSYPWKEIVIPEGIEVTVEKNVHLCISGIDKQKVGLFADLVRSKKAPEPYKGKGIRYEKENVRKKAGKTAKGK